ncbi:hypothetical protein KAH81_01655 [bacterium]|nr:hypothetical protein [bacterium]
MRKTILILLIIGFALYAADSLDVSLLGRFTATSPEDIVVSENRAYIANSSGGLQILDISDPGHIYELGYLFLPGNATGVCLLNDYIGVACSDSAFRILSVEDPSAISVVGIYESESGVYRCEARGDTIFLNGESFTILDASNPTLPSLTGEFTTVFDYSGFDISGNLAYLAEKNYGLSVVDLSDPTAPLSIGHYYALEEFFRGVCTDRWGRVYLAANSGVFAMEWIDDSLREIGYWESPDPVHDITIDGIFAFIACGHSGMRVLDISNPSDISEVGYYSLGSECTDIFLNYPTIWVTGLWARINAMDITSFADIEDQTSLPDANYIYTYPNPFNSAVTISFDGVKVPLRVEIFDLAGRRVARLPDDGTVGDGSPVPTANGRGDLAPKNREFTWQPDAAIGSGVYLVRAKYDAAQRPDGKTATERVVYLK